MVVKATSPLLVWGLVAWATGDVNVGAVVSLVWAIGLCAWEGA